MKKKINKKIKTIANKRLTMSTPVSRAQFFDTTVAQYTSGLFVSVQNVCSMRSCFRTAEQFRVDLLPSCCYTSSYTLSLSFCVCVWEHTMLPYTDANDQFS